jgi:uncharacterized tellurite resistance protein B-like protein
MSIVEYFDYPDRKQNKEHFKDLVHVALADGRIEDSELKLLHRMGKNRGLTDVEIDDLMESSTKSSYSPPYQLARRFEQMYDIIKMVLADGKIDENEMRLARWLALKSGFAEPQISDLLTLLIEGINLGGDEENLFKLYKKTIRS